MGPGQQRKRLLRAVAQMDFVRLRREFLPDDGLPPRHFLLVRGGRELICGWDSASFETATDFELTDPVLAEAVRQLLRSAGLVFDSMAVAVAHAREQGWRESAQRGRA